MIVLKREQKMFTDILDKRKKLVQKLRNLLGGRGGGHQKITLDYRGERGRSKGSEKELRSLKE